MSTLKPGELIPIAVVSRTTPPWDVKVAVKNDLAMGVEISCRWDNVLGQNIITIGDRRDDK